MLYKTNRYAVWRKPCPNRSQIRRDQTNTSIIGIMNLLVIFTLCVPFLIDIAHCDPCSTQFRHLNKDETSFMCPKRCLKENRSDSVTGTDIYDEDSRICSAAIHAGILFKGGKGGNVSFVAMPGKRTRFQGTIRNRVHSLTYTSWELGLGPRVLKFTSPKLIPPHMDERSVVSDVVMVHNSYANQVNSLDDLWVTCLSEDTSLRPEIRIWRYNENGYPHNNNSGNDTVSFPSDSNERVFECRGHYPINDVWGTAMKNKTDTYMAEAFTFTKPQNSGLTINFVRSLFGDKVFKWFLPDRRNDVSEDSLPIHFKTLKSPDEGVYFIGSTREGNQLDKSAFVLSSVPFQVIVRECPDEFYGRNCEHQCQKCHNGVCHPLIGACICQPGFYGRHCDQTCKCDRFGSKCQFKCSEHFLPRKVDGCRGLIFCLARPYGCSCYRGYKGQFCYEEDSHTSCSLDKEMDFHPTETDDENETETETYSQLTVIIQMTVIVVLLVIIIIFVTIMLMKYKCKSSCRGNNSENENQPETTTTTTSRTVQIGPTRRPGHVPVFFRDERVQIGVPEGGAASNAHNEDSDEDVEYEPDPDEPQDGFQRFLMGFPDNTKHIYAN